MLETIMISDDDRDIDVAGIKKVIEEKAKTIAKEEDFDAVEKELFAQFAAQPLETVDPAETESTPAPEDDKKDKKDGKKKDKDKKSDKEDNDAKS